VAPPNQIVINIEEILKQGGFGYGCNPINELEKYNDDATLSEDSIREIVLAWLKSQGWKKTFAKKMEIKSVTPYPALRYELSSYCEDRKTQWRVVPFRGGLIDGPQNGIPPGPWDIPVFSTGLFKPEKHYREFTPAFDATRRASSYAKIAMEMEDHGAFGAAGVGDINGIHVASVMEPDSGDATDAKAVDLFLATSVTDMGI